MNFFDFIAKKINKREKQKFKKILETTHPLERDQLKFKNKYPNHQYGYGSYGIPEVYDWGEGHSLIIGKFCSIASGVKILLGGNHIMSWVTTHPMWVFLKDIKLDQEIPLTIKDIVIGNDVWLATDSLIISGVNIGHGAVVGARSVVTKDVPPYAIVGGNPAQIIRYRFSEDVRNLLLANPWWDLPEDEIIEIAPLLCSDRIDELLNHIRKRNNN